MSDALQCDRCAEFTVATHVGTARIEFRRTRDSVSRDSVDLCEGCRDALEAWIDDG